MKPYEYENVVINFGIKDLIFTLKENIPKQLGFKALKKRYVKHHHIDLLKILSSKFKSEYS